MLAGPVAADGVRRARSCEKLKLNARFVSRITTATQSLWSRIAVSRSFVQHANVSSQTSKGASIAPSAVVLPGTGVGHHSRAVSTWLRLLRLLQHLRLQPLP